MSQNVISSTLLFRLLLHPHQVFNELAETRPSPYSVFFKFVIWLAIFPPVFAYLGASRYGWQLGATEPVFFAAKDLFLISLAYFGTLIFGFLSAAIVSRWMAVTYDARESLGIHLALIAIVAAPLAVGSVIHLYPDVFINIVALVPVLMWSMYLLYRGLPIVLNTSPERGMLMASSLIGYLLVAAVSLLGITVYLWVAGFGPAMGI
jgi:hypothetical protein